MGRGLGQRQRAMLDALRQAGGSVVTAARQRAQRPRIWLRPHTGDGLIGLGSAVVTFGLPVLLWQGPKAWVGGASPQLTPKERLELEDKARGTLAQILGGLVILGGLYFTWRRVFVAQEGQVTERFTRAIEQLGSDQLEIRLGGIYALERVVRDSVKDHWPIMEVLTAYVRQHARRRQEDHPTLVTANPFSDTPRVSIENMRLSYRKYRVGKLLLLGALKTCDRFSHVSRTYAGLRWTQCHPECSSMMCAKRAATAGCSRRGPKIGSCIHRRWAPCISPWRAGARTACWAVASAGGH
jgi:hypothetical protein